MCWRRRWQLPRNGENSAIGRVARRRQGETAEQCEKGLGVLLTESVQQGKWPVSRESLPLPIRCEDGRWLCSLDWLGFRSLEGLAPGFCFARQASFRK